MFGSFVPTGMERIIIPVLPVIILKDRPAAPTGLDVAAAGYVTPFSFVRPTAPVLTPQSVTTPLVFVFAETDNPGPPDCQGLS